MGFLVSQHGQLGAIPPPPFLSVSPLKNIRSGGAIPPPSKEVSQRYLRDTLWKQGKWVRYPPLRYYLERVLRDMGGISHWAAKGLRSDRNKRAKLKGAKSLKTSRKKKSQKLPEIQHISALSPQHIPFRQGVPALITRDNHKRQHTHGGQNYSMLLSVLGDSCW